MNQTLRFTSFGLVLALALLASPRAAHAGPWTKSLGSYYAKLSVGGYMANGFRDAGGTFQKGVTYQSAAASLYAEAGLYDRLQLSLYAPFMVARNTFDGSPSNVAEGRQNAEYVRTSMADTLVGLQWSAPWSLPHAVRAEVKLPLYEVNGPEGPQQLNFPAPGDGQLDMTLWASIGQSFEKIPVYVLAELGHMLRTEKFLFGEPIVEVGAEEPTFNDSLRWFGQGGLKFLGRNYLMLNFQGQWPYQSNAFTKGWVNVGGGLFLPVGDRGFAFEASVDQAVYVVNAANGTSASVGVSLSK